MLSQHAGVLVNTRGSPVQRLDHKIQSVDPPRQHIEQFALAVFFVKYMTTTFLGQSSSGIVCCRCHTLTERVPS